MTDATGTSVHVCPGCDQVVPSPDWHKSIIGGYTCRAIPNRVPASDDCPPGATSGGADESAAFMDAVEKLDATRNRVEVIAQAIADHAALHVQRECVPLAAMDKPSQDYYRSAGRFIADRLAAT